MSDCIIIDVPGEAVGKGAPRFVRATGRVYPSTKSAQWMARVQDIALMAAPEEPWTGPVSVEIEVARPLLKSMSKAARARALAGELLPTSKPDCSNYAKGVEDALSGVIFGDDAQVVELVVRKRYGVSAGTRIRVRRLG